MSNVINIPLGQKKEGKKATIIIGSNEFEVSVEPQDVEQVAYICVEAGDQLAKATDFKDVKKGLKKAFDSVLGKGAFKKIWAESGSLMECSEVFLQISEQLAAQVPKVSQADRARQFAKSKKNK